MRTGQSRACLGCQPIFDRARNIVAHELLYRAESDHDTAVVDDDAVVTERVIQLAVERFGPDLSRRRLPAFVNVDAELLMSRAIETLPADRVVFEILETVNVDAPLVRRCRQLHSHGYRLALDDFLYGEIYEQLLDIVDIVKIDLLKTDVLLLSPLVARLRRRPIALVAEKVDSAERASLCRRLGFDFFQGFFFGRPAVLAG